MNEPLGTLLRRALALSESGRDYRVCLVVRSRGSTPQSPGALMLVDDALNTFGTIGGGCVEAEVRRQAFELLTRRETALVKFKLDHDYGWDDGLICGGTLELAISLPPAAAQLADAIARVERRAPAELSFEVTAASGPATFTLSLPPRERLLIAGAGHVGQALARLAINLEFDVTLIDDRADLLERWTPPGAASVAGDIAHALRNADINPHTYCVIVTRGHKHDEQALHAVLSRGARYVGMIGSRRKVKLIFDDLRALGVPDHELAKVFAPIGLGIGAITVEEIAISIAAQLVEVRRESGGPVVTGPADAIAQEAAAS